LPDETIQVENVWKGFRPGHYVPCHPVASFEAFGLDQLRNPDGVMIPTPICVEADWQVN
jgi:hypothetical protein